MGLEKRRESQRFAATIKKERVMSSNQSVVTATGDQAAPNAMAQAHYGAVRFFNTVNFRFQTLRALMETPAGSADINEVLETLKLIVDGDVQSWYANWSALSDRVFELAESTADRLSSGNAYLRAHNYQRTAEFLLPPDDPKRPASWDKSLARYGKGLGRLRVAYEQISIPYEGGNLRAHFFPGGPESGEKPLIMIVGGFDSILEELYGMLGKGALDRGYSVLAYEGPGQGQVLRDGLKFTHEWEKPTSAVLDEFLRTHAKPKQIVLVGMSMGGYFAPRAAAFEKRIDGVVAWDQCYDFGECARLFMRAAADPVLSRGADFVWTAGNACWTLGLAGTDQIVQAFAPYTLAPVANRITQPVLIMAGELDHGIPLHQAIDFKNALVNAKSVTLKIFDRASGGAEHCQTGNQTLVHAAIFDWVLANFS
ncbi:MAG: dipeptidyl aminopeptidase [Blastocatellia bacterium]|nr:MAG: dipeptidyl aminopeptidase [Blastocatellia bacterium]